MRMKTKKLIALALSGIIGLCSLTLELQYAENSAGTAYAADDYTTGTSGSFNYRKYAEFTVISGTSGTLSGAVAVPETIEGLPVVTIFSDAFKGQNKMTSL